MTKFTVKITNDLLETRIYTTEATIKENAIAKCLRLYKFNNCPGKVTKVDAIAF